jgi:DNA-binding CsgD family transcriptional regulator
MTMPGGIRRDLVLPSLRSIGLSADADLVYRQLITFGPHGVADLSQALGVTPNRMRMALDELSDIGAARTAHDTRGPARRWFATEPRMVVADVRARQREAAAQRHRLHRSLARVTELGLTEAVPGSRVLSSITRAQARVGELVAVERHEHLVMNPTPSYDEEAVRAASGANKSLLDNRISILELGVPPVAADATGELTAEFASAGAQFRQLPSVPVKFMIFDRGTALVRVDAEDPNRGVLEISDPAIIHALVELFMRYWTRANTYGTGSRHVQMTERECRIVQLLAAGTSDTEVAAELGLSVRTIAYTLRDLMDKFGAKNRFQLGLALGPIIGPPTNSTVIDRGMSQGRDDS